MQILSTNEKEIRMVWIFFLALNSYSSFQGKLEHEACLNESFALKEEIFCKT